MNVAEMTGGQLMQKKKKQGYPVVLWPEPKHFFLQWLMHQVRHNSIPEIIKVQARGKRRKMEKVSSQDPSINVDKLTTHNCKITSKSTVSMLL